MVYYQKMIKQSLQRALGYKYKKYNVMIAEEGEGFTIFLVQKNDTDKVTKLRIERLEDFGLKMEELKTKPQEEEIKDQPPEIKDKLEQLTEEQKMVAQP